MEGSTKHEERRHIHVEISDVENISVERRETEVRLDKAVPYTDCATRTKTTKQNLKDMTARN